LLHRGSERLNHAGMIFHLSNDCDVCIMPLDDHTDTPSIHFEECNAVWVISFI